MSSCNPEFSIETENGKVYSMFDFQDDGTELVYEWTEENGTTVSAHEILADMKMVEANVLVANENSANLTVTFEDELAVVTKIVTVYQGVRFAEVSYNIEVKSSRTNLFNIHLPIYVSEGNVTIDSSLSMFGFYDPFTRMCGEVIFQDDMPAEINPIMKDAPYRVDMLFRHPWKQNINIKMLVGVFDAQNLSYPDQVKNRYYALALSPQKIVTSKPLMTWDYKQMLQEYDVSYVVCRDQDTYVRMSADPQFRKVFNGGDVTVFQVIK